MRKAKHMNVKNAMEFLEIKLWMQGMDSNGDFRTIPYNAEGKTIVSAILTEWTEEIESNPSSENIEWLERIEGYQTFLNA